VISLLEKQLRTLSLVVYCRSWPRLDKVFGKSTGKPEWLASA